MVNGDSTKLGFDMQLIGGILPLDMPRYPEINCLKVFFKQSVRPICPMIGYILHVRLH